ncbi:hypothetical protein CVD28_05460 [Bacillus sp. M6-12]|uniref:YciI family protein n=1 Tax=Bacillus sp. M6-12 TaxID=2054166 RepID=UPI000C76094B|nr:YciI family protein [Bacillus sp. M6-12]PLS18587.1 hypothetical protein CVD28_05460 [Bacillus sp. M6-12]
MKKFLVWIVRSPDFTGDSITGHREHLQKLREAGKLVLAGGFADQTGGAYIIQCESIEAAEDLIKKDPMNNASEAFYQLKEWNAS